LGDFSCEIVYVNDGSTDNTYNEIIGAIESFKMPLTVKVLNIHDNTGQSFALRAGLANASHDVIVFMDGDLQNNPEDILTLLKKFLEGYDLVQGVRINRKDPVLAKKVPSKLANLLLSVICKSKFRDLGCSLKIFYKHDIDNFMFYRGFHRVLPIYHSFKGMKTAEVFVGHRKRVHGVTKYGFSRTFDILYEVVKVNFFENSSNFFIYASSAAGCMLILISFLLLFFRHIFNMTLIVSLIAFLEGLYIFVLSAFLYIGRSFYFYQKQLESVDRRVSVKIFK